MTEQEQVDGQIRIAEKQIRDIVENAGDAVIMIDERGVVEAFNTAAERLFGYGDGEVIGQNVKMLVPEPHRSEHDGHLARYVRKGNSGGVGTRREVAGRRKDGTAFPMDCAVSEMVGEGGVKLSTGEKQLISFARALVRKPRIIILDEATSSVDTETEKKIQDAIHSMLKGRTSFVIAHRLSTIRNADHIAFVRDRQIREWGTHEALMAKRGEYFNLYTMQFEKMENTVS